MIDKYGTEQDPYCYPNSQVLKNLLDIKDENTLEKAERVLNYHFQAMNFVIQQRRKILFAFPSG